MKESIHIPNSKVLLLLLAGMILSGYVSAAHTSSISLDKAFMKKGMKDTYTFTVTDNGVDPIYKIAVGIPSASGFSMDVSSISCPGGWSDIGSSPSEAVCFTDAFGGNIIGPGSSEQMSFSATAPNPSSDAQYVWGVDTTDNTGNTFSNTEDAKTTIDVTAPSYIWNTPATDAYYADGDALSVDVSVIDTGSGVNNGLDCSPKIDGTADSFTGTVTYFASTKKCSGTITLKTQSGLSDGAHRITVSVPDKIGNLQTSDNRRIQIDNTAPVVGAITVTPSYDGTVKYVSGKSTISAAVTETGSGIKACEYTLNWGAANPAWIPIDGGSCTATDVDTSSASSVNMRAIDNVGNAGTGTNAVALTPDTTPPTVSLNGISRWQNATATATLACTDNGGSGCNALSYGYKQYTSAPANCPKSRSEYTFEATVTVSSHQWVCAYAEDNVGNPAVSSPAEFKIDNLQPTITNDYAYDGTWADSDQTITLNPQDTGDSDIRDVKYCIGADCDPDSGIILADPYQLSYAANQDNIVRYQAWDNAGNPSSVGSYAVRIDKTAPIAGVSGAPSGWEDYNSTAAVTCSDSGGSGCDIESYKLYASTSAGPCPTDAGSYNEASPQTISRHSWICSYAEDAAGNAVFSNTAVEFKIDETNPAGALNGVPAAWQPGDAAIDLTCSDDGGSGCDTTYLTVVPFGLTCNSASPYNSPVTVSQHSTACWNVTDNAGNTATGSSEIKVDKEKPTTMILSPDAGSWQQTDYSISLSDTDTGGSNLDKCYYQIESNNAATKEKTIRPCSTPITITVGDLKECSSQGTNQCKIKAYATDAAGNIGETVERTFSIDWTAPTGGYINYTDGYEKNTVTNITVGQGTDEESGISSVQLYKKEAVLSEGTCGEYGNWTAEGTQNPGTTSIALTTSPGTCYMFKYEVTNGAGLTASYESANVLKIDETALSAIIGQTAAFMGKNAPMAGGIILLLILLTCFCLYADKKRKTEKKDKKSALGRSDPNIPNR